MTLNGRKVSIAILATSVNFRTASARYSRRYPLVTAIFGLCLGGPAIALESEDTLWYCFGVILLQAGCHFWRHTNRVRALKAGKQVRKKLRSTKVFKQVV